MDKQIVAELARQMEPDLPGALEKIHRLLDDENLRDMCSEYEQCAGSLRRWLQAPTEHARRIEEYTKLIADLRQEILRFLREHEPGA